MGTGVLKMRLLEFYKKIDMSRLDELMIRFKSEGTNSWFVVAHKQFIWMYDSGDIDQVEEDIEKLTGATDEDDVRERPDIISGVVYCDTLTINDVEGGFDPQV